MEKETTKIKQDFKNYKEAAQTVRSALIDTSTMGIEALNDYEARASINYLKGAIGDLKIMIKDIEKENFPR